jgi:hypothetical protein
VNLQPHRSPSRTLRHLHPSFQYPFDTAIFTFCCTHFSRHPPYIATKLNLRLAMSSTLLSIVILALMPSVLAAALPIAQSDTTYKDSLNPRAFINPSQSTGSSQNTGNSNSKTGGNSGGTSLLLTIMTMETTQTRDQTQDWQLACVCLMFLPRSTPHLMMLKIFHL